MMEEYIVRTEKLGKRFGKQQAVSDISLKIRVGSIYGLLGPNGAGKSTTLKMLTGLLRPSEGQIWIGGEPWRPEHLRSIGALIESPALYGNLTAEENMRVHAKLRGLSQEHIREALETVSLTDTGRKRAAQFSLGMKQRLGMAIALLGHPKLLILDEPTNGLDPIGIQELRELIRSFPAQGMTVILSSHALSEVAQVVEDIGIIHEGRLKYQGALPHEEDIEQLFMNVVRGHKQ